MRCVRCGAEIPDKSAYCLKCGAPQPKYVKQNDKQTLADHAHAIANKVSDGIVAPFTAAYGTKEYVDLQFHDFFSEVLKRHTIKDAERVFICGTDTTTPKIQDVAGHWPKPWLYARVLVVFLMVFLGALAMANMGYVVVYPTVMVFGSFMVPVATMIFFFEANASRNLSMVEVIATFMVGGIGSLLATTFLQQIIPGSGAGEFVPSMLTGLIEELAKLIIVAIVLNKYPKRNYILYGLAVGAAVGAGFAAFESTGYEFRTFMDTIREPLTQLQGDEGLKEVYRAALNSSLFVILLRGVLAISGHVAYAAISGAAITVACKGEPFYWGCLLKKEFLTLFIVPVLCHGFWDWITIFAIIPTTVVLWLVILVLMRRGIAEINTEARAALEEMPIEVEF